MTSIQREYRHITIPDLGIRWTRVAHFTPWLLNQWGNKHHYQLNRSLDGAQSQSGYSEGEKFLVPVRNQTLDHASHSLFSILTKLLKLLPISCCSYLTFSMLILADATYFTKNIGQCCLHSHTFIPSTDFSTNFWTLYEPKQTTFLVF
jgi:hypothetical protein